MKFHFDDEHDDDLGSLLYSVEELIDFLRFSGCKEGQVVMFIRELVAHFDKIDDGKDFLDDPKPIPREA